MGLVLIIIGLLLAGSYFFWKWNTQSEVIIINANVPDNFPEDGFSHQAFAELLARFVGDTGGVNYERWSQDQKSIGMLNQYLAAVAKYSPENSPQRFTHKNDTLTYWVYAYNAQVIKAILASWPISSVTDLKAPVEIIKGLGFFYKRKYIFGGKAYSLYVIENVKIFDGKGDPRVHFILNCGSGGCPVLRPQLPVGDDLEPFLVQSAKDFVNDEKNLKIDHANKRLHLSTIFKWYKSQFTAAAEHSENQKDSTLVDYIQSISEQPLRDQLETSKDYEIVFIDYDWSVNQVTDAH